MTGAPTRVTRALTSIRQAASQAYGYVRDCLPRGHVWTGRSEEHPNWRGVCTTCGKVAKPRPGWRRYILMGDCIPSEAPAHLGEEPTT